MRADLNKQLCERERYNSKMKYKAVRHAKMFSDNTDDRENLPSFESTMYRHERGHVQTKDFSENLTPLYSQLRKSVGRPWNKFYSELCANFDKRSVINDHILQHLYDKIDTKVFIKDGELWVHHRYSDIGLLKDSNSEYYVDPRDGIIKKNKAHETRKQKSLRISKAKDLEEAKITYWIDDDNVLRKIEDVWFHFELKDIPPSHFVYDKPDDKDFFIVGWKSKLYGSNQTEGRQKSWDQLTEDERARFGVKRLVGESVFDVFLGKNVGRARWQTDFSLPSYSRKRYHASKRTASRKLLKQVGLVK